MGRKKRKQKTKPEQKARESAWSLDRRTFLTNLLSGGCVTIFGWAVYRFLPTSYVPQQPGPQPIADARQREPLRPSNTEVTPHSGAIEIRVYEPVRVSESLHVQAIRNHATSHSSTSPAS